MARPIQALSSATSLGHAISPVKEWTRRSRAGFGLCQATRSSGRNMIVYPAIDIRGGRCVRLVEGDFNRETVFDAEPVDAARRWKDAGAEWLHVVDLDGAV